MLSLLYQCNMHIYIYVLSFSAPKLATTAASNSIGNTSINCHTLYGRVLKFLLLLTIIIITFIEEPALYRDEVPLKIRGKHKITQYAQQEWHGATANAKTMMRVCSRTV